MYNYLVETSGSVQGEALYRTKAEAMDHQDNAPLFAGQSRRVYQGGFFRKSSGHIGTAGRVFLLNEQHGKDD